MPRYRFRGVCVGCGRERGLIWLPSPAPGVNGCHVVGKHDAPGQTGVPLRERKRCEGMFCDPVEGTVRPA